MLHDLCNEVGGARAGTTPGLILNYTLVVLIEADSPELDRTEI
jgi:hypothetical protein